MHVNSVAFLVQVVITSSLSFSGVDSRSAYYAYSTVRYMVLQVLTSWLLQRLPISSLQTPEFNSQQTAPSW